MNQALAKLFDQIADLLEMKGEDRFRVASYRRVARSLADLTEDVAELAQAGKLDTIPAVGKSTQEKIEEYLSKGHITLHQKLLACFPEGLLNLLNIPGLGPKKVAVLHEKLGITGIADLEGAIAEGKLETLPGFGKKSAEKIKEGIIFLATTSGRIPLGVAWQVASRIREQVATFPGVARVEFAGSLRRGCETIGDIDLLCEGEDGPDIIRKFTELPIARSVLAAGDTKGSITVDHPYGGALQIDLRVVPRACFGAALQYFTGSKEHNVRLRELAVKKGWKLNEYGLFEDNKVLAALEEADIYKKLGFTLMPPEAREDRGEIECRGRLPKLVELADIRGDLHMHTTASDGRSSVEDMVHAAKHRGYAYIAITDHSRSSVIANGLSIERLEKHVEAIHALKRKIKGITILAGVECDILPDGSLDYPDEILARLDWVVASIHAAQGHDRERNTRRTINAMHSPYVSLIGHPSGRLIHRRDAMTLDWEQVFAAAVETHTALEISASWQRLDLKDTHVRQAMEAGCWLCINTDAHSVDQYDQMAMGVMTARRGWATKDRVINTLPAEDLKHWIAAKRKHMAAHTPPQ